MSATREAGGRVLAVGTTTVRALESAAARGELEGRTDLFITPGFGFRVVDRMMTNFHLPRSSLLAMVEAFAGPRWRDLYATALQEGYRFLSFGDAMLLERELLERELLSGSADGSRSGSGLPGRPPGPGSGRREAAARGRAPGRRRPDGHRAHGPGLVPHPGVHARGHPGQRSGPS